MFCVSLNQDGAWPSGLFHSEKLALQGSRYAGKWQAVVKAPARVARPTAPTASESQVIPSNTAVAKLPARKGRPRKQIASIGATVQRLMLLGAGPWAA